MTSRNSSLHSELMTRVEGRIGRSTGNMNNPQLSLLDGADSIYFADSGSSLKCLEWRAGRLRKIPNHPHDFGLTDCLSQTEDVLVVSGYDLDNGCAALNLLYRDAEQQDLIYLASLSDGQTPRVLSLAARQDRGRVHILTGGQQVKLWTKLTTTGEDDENVVKAEARSLVCSQTLSESELSEDDSPLSPPGSDDPIASGNILNDKTSGFCNCNLM